MSAKPVCLPDGQVENFTVRTDAGQFKCQCGANVFHKHDDTQPNLYTCNGCGTRYVGATPA